MRLLRSNRRFRRLWLATILSSLSGWGFGIAMSVQIFTTTGSVFATAGLLAAGTVPAIVLGSVGGVVADRVRRDRVLIMVSWLRVLAPVSLLITDGQLIIAYVAVAAQSALMQFFTPAEQAMVADVVGETELAEAMSANATATNVMRLVGPVLGGTAIGVLGYPVTITVIAGLLVGAAVLLSTTDLPGAVARAGARVSVLRGWTDGARMIMRRPEARGVAVLQLLDSAKEGPLTALYPALMLATIQTSTVIMGAVNSSFAVTAVLAAPLVVLITKRLGYRGPIAVGAGLSGVLLMILVAVPSEVTAFGSFLLAGFPFTISWVAANTWLLTTTPADFRGRAVGFLSAATAAMIAICGAIAGLVADHVGVLPVLAVAAGLQVLAGPIFWLMTRRVREVASVGVGR